MAHSMIRRSIVAGVVVTAACTQAMKVTKDDSPTVLAHQLITAPNPGEKGSFAVKTMYYGSGTDKRRAEFRDSVTIKTRTVDASPFVSIDPPQQKQREKDWGFTPSKFPVNGGLRCESDGPAWMPLKHLEQWKRFNDSTAGPFFRKVDMNNIGIMGHSRGGEAVGIAAAFNRLSHYPDDANVKFNFNFNIRAVFAI